MRQKTRLEGDALFVGKRAYIVTRRYDNKIVWKCPQWSSNCKGSGSSMGNQFVTAMPYTCALFDKSPFKR